MKNGSMQSLWSLWRELRDNPLFIVLAWIFIIGALAGCRIPSPRPPVPPTPTPVCEAGQVECYHNPGSGWVWACATGENVHGPEQCPGAPPVEPKPLAGIIRPGANYELLPRTVSPYNDAINQAMSDAMLGQCPVSSDCPVTDTQLGAAVFRDRVAQILRERGLCAGTQEAANDAPLAVAEWDGSACADDEWTHPMMNFGGYKIRWQPSANDPPDHWRRVSGAPPAEPPVEPVPLPGECPPLRFISVHARPQADWIVDATPKTGGREVCDKLGFTNRNECPFAPELEGRENPERVRCEKASGPYTWAVNGVDCVGCENNGNPLQIRVTRATTGRVTVCGGNGVCGSAVLE